MMITFHLQNPFPSNWIIRFRSQRSIATGAFSDAGNGVTSAMVFGNIELELVRDPVWKVSIYIPGLTYKWTGFRDMLVYPSLYFQYYYKSDPGVSPDENGTIRGLSACQRDPLKYSWIIPDKNLIFLNKLTKITCFWSNIV